MALGTSIDLDRVIFDPEYRRNVIDALNRGEEPEDMPRARRFDVRVPVSETPIHVSAQ